MLFAVCLSGEAKQRILTSLTWVHHETEYSEDQKLAEQVKIDNTNNKPSNYANPKSIAVAVRKQKESRPEWWNLWDSAILSPSWKYIKDVALQLGYTLIHAWKIM